MPRVQDLPQAKIVKILLKGPMGTGKTAFAMSAGACTQLLDCDRGCRVALGMHDAFREQRLAVDVQAFYATDQKSVQAYTQLKTAILAIPVLIQQGKYPFKVLVLDSLTALAGYALQYVRNTSNPKDGRMAYGLAIDEITTILQTLRYVPINTILIAHTHTDEVDGVSVRELAIYGKQLPNTIESMFDEVYYTTTKFVPGSTTKDYVLQTASTPAISTRSRAALPDGTSMSLGLGEILKRLGAEV